MRTRIRCLLLVGAIGIPISGSANAGGTTDPVDVTIDRTSQPWRASGSLGSARNMGTTPAGAVKEIGCKVETAVGKDTKVTCWAYVPNPGSPGTSFQAQCISTDPKFVAAAASLNGDSMLTFEAYDGKNDYAPAGDCTSILIENYSQYEPKEP